MLFRALALASLGVALLTSASPGAVLQAHHAAVEDKANIVGTWRLFRFENTSITEEVEKPYGDHPLGYFMYDGTGHLSVQIMRNPPLAKFAAVNGEPTNIEKAQAYDAFVSYFGTYRVDQTNHLLLHQVEGGLDTTYTQTDQVRPYRLTADALIIAGNRKDGTRYYRELHRVR